MWLNKQYFQDQTKKIISSFKGFPYLPRWVILVIDVFISIFAFTLAYLIYYQLNEQIIALSPYLVRLSINTIVSLFFFLLYRSYVGIIRYSNLTDSFKVFLATFSTYLSMIVIGWLLRTFFKLDILSGTGLFISFLLTFFGMFFFRMVVRLIHDLSSSDNFFRKQSTPILVFGTSQTSVALADLIKNTPNSPYYLMGFLSEGDRVSNNLILGEPLYSMMSKEDQIKIKKKKIQGLLINPVEQGRREKQAIADYCENNNLKMLAIPAFADWSQESITIDKIKNIQIEELLGRVPINISVDKIAKDLHGKCVMVTGAAGSIGSEIVRQIGKFQPELLLLCDIAESPLHNLQLEVTEKFPKLKFEALISDVRNYDRMEKIFEKYRPAHIYHAAAYKHVPLMEDHPCESICTNVIGTKNVADLAMKYGAEAFVMISTDKAVNPTNVMGASKRIAEIYVQTLYKEINKNRDLFNNFRIITTRFGNVLGSNGSVIPRFKEQIEKGGPITVTHKEITRFFMTIPEACRLVLEAANMGRGGEIFVFDMGTPVKIVDLAKKMIRLAGLKPEEDIKIKFTGLRPGEKLYEELLANEETTKPTYNKKIMIGTVRDNYKYEEVLDTINKLQEAVLAYENESIVKIMKKLVPEFVSANSSYQKLDQEVVTLELGS